MNKLTGLQPRIQMRRVDELKPSPTNPRTHSKKQIALIKASIERFGWTMPIITDETGRVLAGHGRLEAAIELGIDAVPTICVSDLTESEKRAYVITDNRIAELSEWDRGLLGRELDFLVSTDFDFEVTGFEFGDLDSLLGVTNADTDDEIDEVELPDPDAQAISRPDDLWSIGPHRLLCASSITASSWELLLGDERAQMVFSDPPYNVPIDGHVSGLGKVRHREFAMASGEMSESEFISFLRAAFRLCARFSSDGSIHYHCIDWRHLREMQDAADGIYRELKQLAVWVKTNAGMSAFYRSQHELVLIFKNGRAPHVNNFGLGEKGRYRTNVWNYAGANTFRRGRDEDLASHPTVKPVAMVADAILDCSYRDGLVVDPFAGSGTTLVAAHRTGRRGAGIEIDPLYVDCAIRRLQEASGLKAARQDGALFDELEQSCSKGDVP